jgi:hypothetical protein
MRINPENVTVSLTKNLPYNYENLTLTPERLATFAENPARPAPKGVEHLALCDCTAGQRLKAIPETFLNSRDANVRFAADENQIIVTTATSGSWMPQQYTAETIADAPSELRNRR